MIYSYKKFTRDGWEVMQTNSEMCSHIDFVQWNKHGEIRIFVIIEISKFWH
jgi:exo-beta-1,3-glucanase (GH17 family)